MSTPTPIAQHVTEEMREFTCACGATFFRQACIVDGRPYPQEPRCAECEAKARIAAGDAREGRRDDSSAGELARRKRLARELLQVPPRYLGVNLESFQHHGTDADRACQMRALSFSRRYVAQWPDVQCLAVVFRGPPGTGKGHISWSIAKTIVAHHGATVVFVKLADMVRRIRATWRKDNPQDEETVLAVYRNADLLILDEVSAHAFYGEQVHQHLYDVLDHRLDYLRPTILTSNEEDDGLAAILRRAVFDRVRGDGGFVFFGESSWRARRSAGDEVVR